MKAVFDAKPGSGYDDETAERYHFPNRYRAIAADGVGDWVIFRRPRAFVGNAEIQDAIEVFDRDGPYRRLRAP